MKTIFLTIAIFLGSFATTQAQINYQCVAVAATKAMDAQCPPNIGLLRCIGYKGAAFVGGYYQCVTPATTLRNWRRNPNASIRNYRTPQAVASYRPWRLFENRRH